MKNMEHHSVARLGLVLSLTLILGACQKETTSPADTAIEATQQGSPKIQPIFLEPSDGQSNTFTVYYQPGSCATWYGEFANLGHHAYNNQVITGNPSYVRVTGGSCPSDVNYMWLKRGTSNGQFGPYYLISPDQGPANRKILKVRVKNLTVLPTDYYKGEFRYNKLTDTWTCTNATGAYDWSIITSFSICPAHRG
jgi:hypothetical protein